MFQVLVVENADERHLATAGLQAGHPEQAGTADDPQSGQAGSGEQACVVHEQLAGRQDGSLGHVARAQADQHRQVYGRNNGNHSQAKKDQQPPALAARLVLLLEEIQWAASRYSACG